MATLNTKSRANFEEWLENIDNNDLKLFAFANITSKVDFDSDDFMLVYSGISDGEPAGCHMIEARVNGNTKDKQLKKLFLKTSTSLAQNPTRLAFALVPTGMEGYCMGNDIKQALQQSPVEGEVAVNKVHIQWSPSVKWDGDKPLSQVGVAPFVFEKIPFQGYKVDGTAVSKKGKAKK